MSETGLKPRARKRAKRASAARLARARARALPGIHGYPLQEMVERIYRREGLEPWP